MKNNLKILPLVCWILAIVVTAGIYILIVDDLFSSSVKWLSAGFVLLGELALCLKHSIGKHSILMNAQTITGGLYLAVAFILSIIYINLSDPDVKWLIVIQAILLLILTVSDLTILSFEKRTSTSDRMLARNQSVIGACHVLIDRILAENEKSEFTKDLSDISEAIRYSDNSVLSGDEPELEEKLKDLKTALNSDEKAEDVSERIKAIKALIQIRSVYIKQNQRGKF